jgi:predicted O-methyltransferase YrrM
LPRRIDARVVGEIGFLTGFSSIALLLSLPTLTVVSFDGGRHACVKAAKEFIDENFPGRHRLILGNSRETVA